MKQEEYLERFAALIGSPLAYILYTVTVLLGLKVLGANLTWAMVFFPIWGVSMVFILTVGAAAFIIERVTK